MRISQSHNIHNTYGKIDRVERSPDIKRFRDVYQHVSDVVLVKEPKVNTIDNLVVVHDTIEHYA